MGATPVWSPGSRRIVILCLALLAERLIDSGGSQISYFQISIRIFLMICVSSTLVLGTGLPIGSGALQQITRPCPRSPRSPCLKASKPVLLNARDLRLTGCIVTVVTLRCAMLLRQSWDQDLHWGLHPWKLQLQLLPRQGRDVRRIKTIRGSIESLGSEPGQRSTGVVKIASGGGLRRTH